MTYKPNTLFTKPIYCPSCHLSTRADFKRCLHCRKPLPVPRDLSSAEHESKRKAEGAPSLDISTSAISAAVAQRE